jgi:hypothetical protein
VVVAGECIKPLRHNNFFIMTQGGCTCHLSKSTKPTMNMPAQGIEMQIGWGFQLDVRHKPRGSEGIAHQLDNPKASTDNDKHHTEVEQPFGPDPTVELEGDAEQHPNKTENQKCSCKSGGPHETNIVLLGRT